LQGSLDAQLDRLPGDVHRHILQALIGGVVNLLEALLGIQSIEADRALPIPLPPINNAPYGLTDTTPVSYFGSVVTHGYAAQTAGQIIRLTDATKGSESVAPELWR